jgi:3-oxoacyl-[acyl-carrier-protein] synthase II
MSSRQRIAVTGIGMRTPAGADRAGLTSALFGGRTLACTVPMLMGGGAPVTFAGVVPEFDVGSYVTERESRLMERPSLLALAAVLDAVRGAGLDAGAGAGLGVDPDAVGVTVGTGLGSLITIERIVNETGMRLAMMRPTTVPRIMNNSPAAWISARLGAHGFSCTYTAACASGAIAIGEAARKIQAGDLDVAVAGGVDTPIAPFTLSGFARMRMLSTRNNDPGRASRPFDQDRDGSVLSEGASFLVLENWDHALARGASIHGEILGYSSNADAYHVVAPRPDGRLAAACMRRAVQDAGLSPSDIGHINANATSTRHGDEAESLAIAMVFGDDCPPVTAPKGVLGHLIGAAAAVEAVASLDFASAGLVAPVANHVVTGYAEKIDVVSGTPRAIRQPYALSNSFGFGGHNACLVLGSPP